MQKKLIKLLIKKTSFYFSDYMIITEYNHIIRTKLKILAEVLVMIALVIIVNNTRHWLRQTDGRRIQNI